MKECNRQGKHPYSKMNWKLLATDNPENIEMFFDKINTKNLNLAVATGRKGKNEKYLVVIDIDDEKSTFYEKILKANVKTFYYKTGGGGHHFWFWSRNPVKNSVSLIQNKVDIRGTGGYVIVPPSKHISGNKYELMESETMEISNLPEEFETLLNVKKNHEISKNGHEAKTVKKHEVSDLLKLWGNYSVTQIRSMLVSNNLLIPEGTRNYTIFRLLCSDRARGADRRELVRNSQIYRKYCENFPTIDQEELMKIVDSVMKYPIYDNSYENINQKYINWLEKNGIEKEEFLKQKLLTLDNLFFNSLKKSKTPTSLQIISKTREEFFKINGLNQYSIYKPSALGLKLRSLGFERVRTSTCNLWNVDVQIFQ